MRRWGALAALALMLATAPASARERQTVHVVQSGDSGFGIAWLYGVPWADIARANRIDPDAPLHPRQRLVIPKPQAAPAATEQSAPQFEWPLSGEIRRGFTARGHGNGHDGIDITVRDGTAVKAAAAGTVEFADLEPNQFGRLVVIDHGNGWHSAYGFLDRITVRAGQRVRQGQRIGTSGHTGMAQGSELHFELRQGRRPVDPLPRLPERD